MSQYHVEGLRKFPRSRFCSPIKSWNKSIYKRDKETET